MRFCEGIAVAKLGIGFTPGTYDNARNIVLPAIPDNHSILVEMFVKHNSYYAPGSTGWVSIFTNSAINEFHGIRANPITKQWGYVTFSTVGGGGVIESFVPYINTRYQYLAYLLDETSFLKVMYINTVKVMSVAVAANNRPTYNGINNHIYLMYSSSQVPWDCYVILYRITTLSSIPSDIDSAIARMNIMPMALDASLQASAVIASQWDIGDEDAIVGSGSKTSLIDTGIVGGYDLTSGALNMEPYLRIVEKP